MTNRPAPTFYGESPIPSEAAFVTTGHHYTAPRQLEKELHSPQGPERTSPPPGTHKSAGANPRTIDTAPRFASGLPHPLIPQPAERINPPTPTAPGGQDSDEDTFAAQFPALPPGVRQLLFTPEQAAALLSVRASWLRRCAGEGTIACTYLGKHLRFSAEDLQAIIAGGARGWRPDQAG